MITNLRVLSIDPFRQRMGLSLKRASVQEREAWLARQVPKAVSADAVEPANNQNDTK